MSDIKNNGPSDLVERLIVKAGWMPGLEREAADEIERLRAEVARLSGLNADDQQSITDCKAYMRQADKQVERLRAALEEVRHELTTQSGLFATDILPENWRAMQDNGTDFYWQIDNEKLLAEIDKALSVADATLEGSND